MREKTLCQGFFGVVAKSPIVYDILKFMIETDVEEFNKNVNLVIDKLYDYVTDNTNNKNNNTKLYKEESDESNYFTNIYDVDNNLKQKLFTYYFVSKIIPKKVEKPVSVKETKIGISFSVPKDMISIFSNGIRQNVLYLYDLFENIGYDVYMVINKNDLEKANELSFWNKKDKYKYIVTEEVIQKQFNIFIQMGAEVEMYILEHLQDCDVKTIYYCCGNKYLIETEQCLYVSNSNENAYFQYNNSSYFHFSQIWLIPQMMNTNSHYLQTILRSKVIGVPFIWSPSVIEDYEKELKQDLKYVNRGINKKIAIFEPNLSIMKWALPAVLICENTHRTLKNKDLIKHIYVTNTNKTTDGKFDSKIFNGLVKSLDIFKQNKMSIEARYNTLMFMQKYSDVAVSHQMENNLNYLYLDLAWMGWPVVHNANLCSDVGYYNEGFNYEEGGEKLKYAILNHDENVDKYVKTNREIIDRYLPTNKKLKKEYKKLVNSILGVFHE
jgi:hypothetical protein